MIDELNAIRRAAAALDDPYAALSQHLHGDGDSDMMPPEKLWLSGGNVSTTAPEHEWEAQPYTRDDLADPAWRTRALAAIMGPKAAIAYLAQMDPNVGKALVNNGLAVSVEQVRAAGREAKAEASRPARTATMACPTGFALFDRGDKVVCRQGAAPVAPHPAPPAGTACPATHPVFVPGKGCRK